MCQAGSVEVLASFGWLWDWPPDDVREGPAGGADGTV